MGVLKKLYHSLCYRIYAVGKQQAQIKRDLLIRQKNTIAATAVVYPDAAIVNLSGKWEQISIGENSHIYGQLVVYNYGGQITIGSHSSVGDMSRIVSADNISIGSRVMIAHHVNILDNNSHPIDARLRHEDFMNNYSSAMQQYDLKAGKIVIEDDVWIGFNTIILKGVRIGRGAIIGAGSVVTKDVEPWTVNVGNPLRTIQKLEPVNV